MNHRNIWHPEKYLTETKAIEVKLPEESKIDKKFAKDLGKKLGIDDKMRRHNIKKEVFKISFENNMSKLI